MHYYKRLKIFKSKRCTFDPHSMSAWSYNWWEFVACIDGKVVFNNASYSMQTGIQQRKVRELLNCLGVKYRTVYIKSGLQSLSKEGEWLKYKITELNAAINKPRSQKRANKWRVARIKFLNKEIENLKILSRKKRTEFKGKLDFSKLPEPRKLSEQQKARRAENRARREQHKKDLNGLKQANNQATANRAVFKLVQGGAM